MKQTRAHMPKNYQIGSQARQLSKALSEKGVANMLETPKACKFAVICIPQAKVKLKVSDNYHFNHPEQLFSELQEGGKKVHDFSKTVLIPSEKVDNSLEELTNALAEYSLLRFKILGLL